MTKRYDPAFRDEAVRLAVTSSKSISQTARDLGIKEGTLYYWVEVAKSKAPAVLTDNGDMANAIDELNRLRKENARLKEEREILKKAAVFFAREEQKR